MKITTPSQFSIKHAVQEDRPKGVGNESPAAKVPGATGKNSPNPALAQKAIIQLIHSPAATISAVERKNLADCEALIERGWLAFVEVGQALATIRNGRLYREQYKTFDDYCRGKWQYARAHAYRLIGAAEVIRNLSPIGDIPTPLHEAQVRPLIGLPPDQAREAWKKAVAEAGHGIVTAKLVKQMVTEFTSSPRPAATSSLISKRKLYDEALEEASKWLKQAEDVLRIRLDSKAALDFLSEVKKCLIKLRVSRHP